VSGGNSSTTVVQNLGDGQMTIQTTPDEGNAYLIVSMGKPIGEPILGPLGWGERFARQIVGVTHMKRGRQTIQGLPGNLTIYYSYLNYDNNPGVGGASGAVGVDQEVELPVYAAWSNGYHTPPQTFVELIDFLERTPSFLSETMLPGTNEPIMSLPQLNEFGAIRQWIKEHGEKKVDVGTIGQYRVIDLVAAHLYRRIEIAHKSRAK
jgi:hypothetical protein